MSASESFHLQKLDVFCCGLNRMVWVWLCWTDGTAREEAAAPGSIQQERTAHILQFRTEDVFCHQSVLIFIRDQIPYIVKLLKIERGESHVGGRATRAPSRFNDDRTTVPT